MHLARLWWRIGIRDISVIASIEHRFVPFLPQAVDKLRRGATLRCMQKDIAVIQSRHYTIVKIPRDTKPMKRTRKSLADLEGLLEDVPELKGKSSVEVQHMIPKIWQDSTLKNHHSS